MRCKNCGFDNNEGRYICENCGSPLYNDSSEIIPEEEDAENSPAERIDELEETEEANDQDDKLKNKKSLIIIIVLAVILVAMIVGIVVAAVVNKDDETTTAPTVTVSQETTEDETEKTTKKKITTEKTTKTTTERTTEATTAATTTVAHYTVSVDIDGNGSVSGSGTFEAGKRATLIATPDEGYQFVGWYDNDTGAQVASGTKYSITVDSNKSLTARFKAIPEQESSTGGEQGNE